MCTREPYNYEEWLEAANLEDSEDNRSWYECPDGERSEWLDAHPDF